jgi:hypothetical protein
VRVAGASYLFLEQVDVGRVLDVPLVHHQRHPVDNPRTVAGLEASRVSKRSLRSRLGEDV